MTEYYVTGKWPIYLRKEGRLLKGGEIVVFDEDVNVQRLLDLEAVIEYVDGMIIADEESDEEE